MALDIRRGNVTSVPRFPGSCPQVPSPGSPVLPALTKLGRGTPFLGGTPVVWRLGGPPACDMKTVIGNPDYEHVSTSYVERQNLSMRMHMRRFTRLTNAFSKKIENHAAAISLYFAYYNFCRVHQTLRITPAMEAKLTDHVWSVEELVALLPEPQGKKRGPYKKKAK